MLLVSSRDLHHVVITSLCSASWDVEKKPSLISSLRLTFPLPAVSCYLFACDGSGRAHVAQQYSQALAGVYGISKETAGNVVGVWYRHGLCGKFPIFMSLFPAQR